MAIFGNIRDYTDDIDYHTKNYCEWIKMNTIDGTGYKICCEGKEKLLTQYVIFDKPYCPYCGKLIKINEVNKK